MEGKLTSRNEQIKELVRENFSDFVTSKDTIDEIHKGLLQNESTSTSNSSHSYTSFHLAKHYAGSFFPTQFYKFPFFLFLFSLKKKKQFVAELNSQVGAIFDELLEKRKQANQIQKQLSIIDSYQFIFKMPQKLRKNIQKVKKKILEATKKERKSVIHP